MSTFQFSEDRTVRKIQKGALWTVVGIISIIAFGFFFGLLIQFLWNETLVALFGFPPLSFWQAIGLFFLAKLFFGVGGSGSRHAGKKRRKHRRSARSDPEDELSELPSDKSFRKFWEEGGKSAYEEYRKNSHPE